MNRCKNTKIKYIEKLYIFFILAALNTDKKFDTIFTATLTH